MVFPGRLLERATFKISGFWRRPCWLQSARQLWKARRWAFALPGEDPVQSRNFILHGNYPNPFNAATTFQFQLFKDNWVTLTVYNSLGEEVIRLLDKPMLAGVHNIRWEASQQLSISSGPYTYILKAGGLSESRHFILIK